MTVVSGPDQAVDAVVAGDLVQVGVDLRLRRAQPRPVAALGVGERVQVARYVAGGAGVAVVEPGTAEVAGPARGSSPRGCRAGAARSRRRSRRSPAPTIDHLQLPRRPARWIRLPLRHADASLVESCCSAAEPYALSRVPAAASAPRSQPGRSPAGRCAGVDVVPAVGLVVLDLQAAWSAAARAARGRTPTSITGSRGAVGDEHAQPGAARGPAASPRRSGMKPEKARIPAGAGRSAAEAEGVAHHRSHREAAQHGPLGADPGARPQLIVELGERPVGGGEGVGIGVADARHQIPVVAGRSRRACSGARGLTTCRRRAGSSTSASGSRSSSSVPRPWCSTSSPLGARRRPDALDGNCQRAHLGRRRGGSSREHTGASSRRAIDSLWTSSGPSASRSVRRWA